jgi:hypothetical protein
VGFAVSVRFPPGCAAAAWWSGDARCHDFWRPHGETLDREGDGVHLEHRHEGLMLDCLRPGHRFG